MNKTKIEWTDMSWNPLTGCRHGCRYCYARRIADRFASKDPEAVLETADCNSPMFILEEPYTYQGKVEPYPYGFLPTFHMYRLHEPREERNPKRIFVCSMSDLFGYWVPEWVIESVFEACRAAPQHKYLFLTKNPERMLDLEYKHLLPEEDNFWYGSSIPTGQEAFFWSTKVQTFVSMEPLLADPGDFLGSNKPGWIIVGAETGNSAHKVTCRKEWVDRLLDIGVPVFMKESLVPVMGEENMRRELPLKLQ